MSVDLFTDVHVRREVIDGLRRRGVNVLTAVDDGADTLPDPRLLDRAGKLGRVLFSQDEDLPAEAVLRQRFSRDFNGMIYAHQLKVTIGQCIDDLELVAKVCELEELASKILYLPLK